ncbi:MAG: DinB family protein [Cyclobacteriaceae bacterium]
MNSSLQKLFEKLENQRQSLLALVSGLPPEKLNAHPENKWSINQIIAHLITAERMSVQYLRKKMLGVEQAKDSGIWEELKMVLLVLSQRLPIKYKAPKKVVELTVSKADLSQLIEEWNEVRSEMRNILEQIDHKHIKRKIFKHIRAGMLNIQHALKFSREHIIHHTPQIKRLL